MVSVRALKTVGVSQDKDVCVCVREGERRMLEKDIPYRGKANMKNVERGKLQE